MRKSTFWISVLFVFLSFISTSVALGVTVSIVPEEQVVSKVGEVITVNVKVTGVTSLFGFQFDLAFDNSLKATKVEEGGFLKSDGKSTFWKGPKIDNDTGTIIGITCTKLAGGGIDGDGILATITFEVFEVKESKLKLENVKLSNFDVKPIEANIVDGTITTVKPAAIKPIGKLSATWGSIKNKPIAVH
jgi:hypothetical protein